MERMKLAQIMRQGGLLLIIVAVWAVLLVAFLNLTGEEGAAPVAEAPEPTQRPESTEELPTAAVEEQEPTQRPESTEELPTATTAATEALPTATEPAEATSEPTAVPTEPPTATSSPGEPPDQTETPTIPADTPAPPEVAGVSFSEDVLPILTSRCERCHGSGRLEAGLDLLSYDGVMAGSEDGPVVIPGSSATSRLVETIVSGEMPKRAPKLPAPEMETIADWVDEGALDN
jgi:hypothetical protein